MSVYVRLADAADAEWIGEVSRESFAPRLHPFLISAQPGFGTFCAVVLAHPTSFPGRCFLIAEADDGTRLGFADLQSVAPDRAHLSYICVVEDARGRGIAGALLRHYLARHPGVNQMQLDVFDDNEPARALYDRLGFVPESSTTWWGVRPDISSVAPRTGVRLGDLHPAWAWMSTYGFAELSLHDGDQVRRLGRPSASVLRCFDADLLAMPDVIAAVLEQLPGVEDLLVVLDGQEPPASAIGSPSMVNRSTRMSAITIRDALESP